MAHDEGKGRVVFGASAAKMSRRPPRPRGDLASSSIPSTHHHCLLFRSATGTGATETDSTLYRARAVVILPQKEEWARP